MKTLSMTDSYKEFYTLLTKENRQQQQNLLPFFRGTCLSEYETFQRVKCELPIETSTATPFLRYAEEEHCKETILTHQIYGIPLPEVRTVYIYMRPGPALVFPQILEDVFLREMQSEQSKMRFKSLKQSGFDMLIRCYYAGEDAVVFVSLAECDSKDQFTASPVVIPVYDQTMQNVLFAEILKISDSINNRFN